MQNFRTFCLPKRPKTGVTRNSSLVVILRKVKGFWKNSKIDLEIIQWKEAVVPAKVFFLEDTGDTGYPANLDTNLDTTLIAI